MFKHAIVRTPSPEMIHGITSGIKKKPDHKLALIQHKEYVEALRSLGLGITVLEPNSRFPDSTFVEDVALCTNGFAVIMQPGAATRKGEQLDMTGVLGSFYDHIEHIEAPGTIEAGDVLMTGRHFYIGISDRTNHEGADMLIAILEKYQMSGEKIELKKLLHLKSGVSYLEDRYLLAGDYLFSHPAFKRFRIIRVGGKEEYAANSLWVNGTVLVPAGFPKTHRSGSCRISKNQEQY